MVFVEGTGSGKMLTYFQVLGRVTVALYIPIKWTRCLSSLLKKKKGDFMHDYDIILHYHLALLLCTSEMLN